MSRVLRGRSWCSLDPSGVRSALRWGGPELSDTSIGFRIAQDAPMYKVKGGSWDDSARTHRAAFRNWFDPSFEWGLVGFRIAEDISL